MTPDHLTRLSELATPGEWRLSAGSETTVLAGARTIAEAQCGGVSGVRLAEAEANAALIVEMRNSLPQLLARITALEAALERIAGFKGAYSYPWPENSEGYGPFAVMEARAALQSGSEA